MILFWQTLQIVAPVFLLAFVGLFLKKIKLIDRCFVDMSSRLVFNVALPCLVFVKLSVVDFNQLFNPKQIVYICTATGLAFVLIWSLGRFRIRQGRDLSAFIQGAFRSNFSIVGFAIVWNLFGEDGLARAAMILAFLMPLYNIYHCADHSDASGKKDTREDADIPLYNQSASDLRIDLTVFLTAQIQAASGSVRHGGDSLPAGAAACVVGNRPLSESGSH